MLQASTLPPDDDDGDSGFYARRGSAALDIAGALFDGSDEVVLVIDASGGVDVVAGASALEDLIGLGIDEAIEKPLALVRDEDRPRVSHAFRSVHDVPGSRTTLSFWVQHASGGLVQIKATLINRFNDGVLGALLVRLRELPASLSVRPSANDAKRDGRRISDRIDDRVSGMVTREEFLQAVRLAVKRKDSKIWSASRYARSISRDRRYDYAVVLLELDPFKMLIGGYGHEVAASLVAQVADRLAQVLRGRDAFAHLGGGEFGILLDAVGDTAHATQVIDRLNDAFQKHFNVANRSIAVTPVMGVTTSERRYDEASDVMRDAAAAVSHAQRRPHRRRAAFDTKMRVADLAFLRLVGAMNDGLANRQFHVHYQPIIDLMTHELVGFEALARWYHPELGEVEPEKFIPAAEQSGLIMALGQHVLEQACEQVAAWTAVYPSRSPLTIGVNVSGVQLEDARFLKMVEQSLRQSGLAPEQLKLEITEGVVLKNIEAMASVVARLRLYGVSFFLDDFGTGYSSLSYLQKLPYDAIKIDRSFFGTPEPGLQPAANSNIVRAIISMAHDLQMKVVAEGVECETQSAALKQLGCDFAQGFHFARPMPAAQAERLLADRETKIG